MHKRISLSGGDWLFKDFYGEDWRWRGSHLPGTSDRRGWRAGSVPGCPHHDLWRLGEIPDPYVERNSLLIEWIPQRTWVYKKTFGVPEEIRGRRVRLHFEGVDYQAEFFLNGESLGSHTGMFTPAEFEVADKLHYGGGNLLAVVIEPAPAEQPQVGRTGRVHSLKTRMNYWWDFCPRMVHVGIWDEVYLEISGPVRLADVFVRPGLLDGFHHAEVAVFTGLDAAVEGTVDLEVTLRQSGEAVARARTRHVLKAGPVLVETRFDLPTPRLWWPNGYGTQALYQAEVRVMPCREGDGGPGRRPVSDSRTVSFGIRRLECVANESAGPEALPYTFVVNGRRVYAKGWNWVPVDIMYGVPRPDKLERLLTLARRARVNLLRVWGGGLIEKEAFYGLCDRLGILVWQEFIQSSSGIENLPSTSPDYVRAWTEAAQQIIPRRRNHPALAAWCGGNELSGEGERPLDDSHPVLAALKSAVRRLDPDRLWLPTSPSGPVFGNSLEAIARDPAGLHDVHGPWEYQGLHKQYELYNRGTSLFHSEFGVEGITNLRTLDATVRKEHQWPVSLDNPCWSHRGAWWVKRPMWEAAFGELPDVAAFVRATQFLQAEGLRYAVEADRRRKYRNSGTLPWQFNEPYPMAACTSAVDYYTRPKPAYYAVARAYAPLALSARFDRAAWDGCEAFEAEAWICNSNEQPFTGHSLRMRVTGWGGQVYAERVKDVSFGPDCAARLGRLVGPMANIPEEVFFLDLELLDPDGGLLCRSRYPFSRTATLAPLLACPAAELSVTASRSQAGGEDEYSVTLANSGRTTAMYVWLEDSRDLSAPGSTYFDDNYFCLLPGERRTLVVTCRDVPAGERRLEISAWNAERSFLDLSTVEGT